MSGTLAGVTSLGSEVVLYVKIELKKKRPVSCHAMTRDWRKVDLHGPALRPRCAAGITLHLLTFLNEARGPKKTVGDGVARRRQVHQEHLLLDVATSDAAPLSTREPDARRRLTRRGEARITLPEIPMRPRPGTARR